MTENNQMIGSEAASELVITRVFNAPAALVFSAFADETALAQWWGPAGLEICDSKLDFRAGGMYHYGIKTPDGHIMWGKFSYLEIDEPSRIVFISSFSDEGGNVTRAPFSPVFPLEVHNTITFAENEGKTTLTLKGYPVNASEDEHNMFSAMSAGMQQGFGGTFDQLEQYLAKISI